MKILAFLFVLFLPSSAWSQIACFNYGSIVSCDGPSGNTTIAPLSSSQGIITQHGNGRSTLEPYTIIPAPEEPRLHRSSPFSSPSDSRYRDDPPGLALPGLGLPSLDLPGLELP